MQIYDLPLVLYGFETWPLIRREMADFENRVQRTIFGRKREEIAAVYNNKIEFYDTHSSPRIITKIKPT
jgi:hypothetical protein